GVARLLQYAGQVEHIDLRTDLEQLILTAEHAYLEDEVDGEVDQHERVIDVGIAGLDDAGDRAAGLGLHDVAQHTKPGPRMLTAVTHAQLQPQARLVVAA